MLNRLVLFAVVCEFIFMVCGSYKKEDHYHKSSCSNLHYATPTCKKLQENRDEKISINIGRMEEEVTTHSSEDIKKCSESTSFNVYRT